jgi:hypothetical protein
VHGKLHSVTCTCTPAFHYWSSTSDAASSADVWVVSFRNGFVVVSGKGNSLPVRAVRGGL